MDIQSHPITIGGTDLLKLQKAFTLSFGYGHPSPLQYTHTYENGKTNFTITYDGELPAGIKVEDAIKLHKIEVGNLPAYFYSATISDTGIVENNDATTVSSIKSNIERQRQGRAETPPAISHEAPQSLPGTPSAITIPEIAQRMTNKRYLLFTGAGLSASVVPEWDGLMRLMGYQKNRNDTENLADTLNAINNRLPELMSGLDTAHRAFIVGTPTAGHRAIASMSNLLHRPTLTDNRDLIQQAAGTQAIHVHQLTPFTNGPWQPPVSCDAKDIDGVIVCGMGGDRRGFLQWLKSNNPQAEIIHMDIVPSNQMKADRFIQGDLQTLLPQLQSEVQTQFAHAAQANRPSFAELVRR